jgi:Response regulators consisting of a CheY-like receiver domain and a winged-helix DNA-binding domain
MNGYQAAKAIRELEDEKLANVPIIAMSANALEEDKKESLRSGMDMHLAKPIEMDKVLAALEWMMFKN